jgi:hypothetical protein
VIGTILIGSCRKGDIEFESVVEGLSDGDIKFSIINNIESILNYHYYKKQCRVINDTAKEFTAHPSNIN